MSVHKETKVRNLIQQRGLLQVGSAKTASTDIGLVGAYDSGAPKFAGLFRDETDGIWNLFDGLTSTPFASDAVNKAGAGFQLSALNLGQLNATTLSSTSTNGDLTLAPNGTGRVILTNAEVTAGPTTANGVVSKIYVDGLVQGFVAKASVVIKTTGELAVVAAGSGVGKTLTSADSVGGTAINQAIADVAAAKLDNIILELGDRLLVANQTATHNNGIYTVTAVGGVGAPWVLTRAPDADNNPDGELTRGAHVFVDDGDTHQNTGWVLQGPFNTFVIDDPTNGHQVWVKFSKELPITYTAISVGTNAEVYKGVSGTEFQFRDLAASFTAGDTGLFAASQGTNDITFNFDQSKLTGTGVLASGSIAAGFGTIATANSIAGSSLETAGPLTFTGASGVNVVTVPDAESSALKFTDGTTDYFHLSSTDNMNYFDAETQFNTPAYMMNRLEWLDGAVAQIYGPSGATLSIGARNGPGLRTYIDIDDSAQKVFIRKPVEAIAATFTGAATFSSTADFNGTSTFTSGVTLGDLATVGTVATAPALNRIAAINREFIETSDYKNAVRAISTADVPLTADGAVGVYGATWSGGLVNINSLTAFDGVTLVVGDRILIAANTNSETNGIYIVNDLGSGATPYSLSRDTDACYQGSLDKGAYTLVREGTTYAHTFWTVTASGTLDTDPVVWTECRATAAVGSATQLAASGGQVANIYKQNAAGVLQFRAIETGIATNATNHIEIVEDATKVTISVDPGKITTTGNIAYGSINNTTFGDINTNALIAGLTLRTAGLLEFSAAAGSGSAAIVVENNLVNAFHIRDTTGNEYFRVDSDFIGSLFPKPVIFEEAVTIDQAVNQTADNSAISHSTLRARNAKNATLARSTGDLTTVAAFATGVWTGLTVDHDISLDNTLFDSVSGALMIQGERILVMGQTDPAANGIYYIKETGSTVGSYWQLERATDANTADKMMFGSYVVVTLGSAWGKSMWVCTTKITTLDTDAITFEQVDSADITSLAFTGGTGANTITAPDNLADALSFKSTDGKNYLRLVTTNGAEQVELDQPAVFGSDATVGGSLQLTGTGVEFLNTNSGLNVASLQDNLADALSFSEGANQYLTFQTTNASEAVVANKPLLVTQVTSAATSAVNNETIRALSTKSACYTATSSNLTVTAAGSGATHTLTATSNGTIASASALFDGTAMTILGTRVCVWLQTAKKDNGIYRVTDLGSAGTPWVLTRAEDLCLTSHFTNNGIHINISTGFLYGGSRIMSLTNAPTMETTNIVFFMEGLSTNTIQFNDTSDGVNSIFLIDELADSLHVGGTIPLMRFNTVGGQEKTIFSAPVTAESAVTITGDTSVQGLTLGVTSLSSNTTLTAAHNVINVTTGAGNITLTLPPVASSAGRTYKIAKIDAGAGSVVIAPDTTNLIDGENVNIELLAQYDYTRITCHGTVGWFLH